jgi:hypothetical protein
MTNYKKFITYILFGIILGGIFGILYQGGYDILSEKTNSEPIVTFNGYHFHHSMYGAILIPIGFIISNPIIIGLGIGIIIEHTVLEEKYIFIEKQNL